MGQVELSKTFEAELGVETRRGLNAASKRRKADRQSRAKGAYGGLVGNMPARSSREKGVCEEIL